MASRARPRSAAKPRASTPPASDPASEAWALVLSFFKTAKAEFLAAQNLTMAQAQLLLHLEPERPMPMSELAVALGCDASNVTGLVDRLEDRKLIERQSAADRRVKMVAFTPLGGKERDKLLERWLQAPSPIARLPRKDQKELLRILRKAAAVSSRASVASEG